MNAPSETIRTFIALNIPAELHEPILRVQSRLHYLSGASAMRWSRPEQFHVTLEFLGNIERSRIAELKTAIQSACGHEAPLKLSLHRAGCFPSFSKPTVAWLDVGGDVARLMEMQKRIRCATQGFGDRGETHDFSQHLTLGRVRNGCFRSARDFGKALEGEAKNIGLVGEWETCRVAIMRSEATPTGSLYSELGHTDLCT